jgi:hypothetical protein
MFHDEEVEGESHTFDMNDFDDVFFIPDYSSRKRDLLLFVHCEYIVHPRRVSQ